MQRGSIWRYRPSLFGHYNKALGDYRQLGRNNLDRRKTKYHTS